MIRFFNGFVKVTGIIPYWLCFRTKIYYMNKKKILGDVRNLAMILAGNTLYALTVTLFLLPLFSACNAAGNYRKGSTTVQAGAGFRDPAPSLPAVPRKKRCQIR